MAYKVAIAALTLAAIFLLVMSFVVALGPCP